MDFCFETGQIEYKTGYKYQLHADTIVHIPVLAPYAGRSLGFIEILPAGRLKIKKGYAWDGASGPTYDSLSTMRAALIHDVLYQLMRNKIIPESFRGMADELLYDIGTNDGMCKLRAGGWVLGLDAFGAANAKAGKTRTVHRAPKEKYLIKKG